MNNLRGIIHRVVSQINYDNHATLGWDGGADASVFFGSIAGAILDIMYSNRYEERETQNSDEVVASNESYTLRRQ